MQLNSKFIAIISSVLVLSSVLPVQAVTSVAASTLVTYTGATSSTLGSAFARGDVNGDGYEDLLIGALSDGTLAGAAYLLYGQSTAESGGAITAASNVITFTGSTAGDRAGISVALGDFDADGFDDVAVGADSADLSAADAGAVYVVYGSATTLSSITLSTSNSVVITGEAADDRFGTVLAVGDMNADGSSELLIGAPKVDDGSTNNGAVYIAYGSTTQTSIGTLSASVFKQINSNVVTGARAGTSLAVGDFNNDTYDDFVTGGPLTTNGSVYIKYGQSTQISSGQFGPNYTGDGSGDQLGTYVASGGDINGDGYDDIIAAAPSNDIGASNAGAIYVLYGQSSTFAGGLMSTAGIRLTGSSANGQVGTVGAGDYNGDNLWDITIGSALSNSSAGLVGIIAGSTTALSNSTFQSVATVSVNGSGTTGTFGRGLGSADLNGDGYDELLIGETSYETSAGAVYMMYSAVDADQDGVLDDSGSLTTGTDCSDQDATVSTDQTYYEDLDGDGNGSDVTGLSCTSTPPDGYSANSNDNNDDISNANIEINNNTVDDDGDGEIDEVNTPDANGDHPYYATQDSAENAAVNIVSVAGTTSGDILVTYADDSTYLYDIYASTVSSDTMVEQYGTTGYGIVLHKKGKKVYLVNLYTGAITDKVTIKKSGFDKAAMVLFDLRNNKDEVVVTGKTKANVTVAIVKVNKTTGTVSKSDSATVKNKNIKETKTKAKSKEIQLRSSKNKVLETFTVTKKYKLK